MKLVDLEQKVFIPIVDASKGGATYEVQMSVAEVFEKFFEGNTPQIVEAVPVVHGRWVRQSGSAYVFKCSACGFKFAGAEIANYCPNCGAKMDRSAKK